MDNLPVLRGQLENKGFVFIQDTTSTTGAGLTGVTSASSGLSIAMRREKSSTMTAYTGGNIGAISTLGTWANPGTGKVNIKAVDATNAPGLYELHFENAIYDAGDTSRKLVGFIQGVANMAPTPFEVTLVAVDMQDSARFGLTQIPSSGTILTGSTVVDGLTLTSIFELLIALAAGKDAVVDNGDGTKTVTFKKQDGTTTKFTVTYNYATEVRTASSVS